MNNTILRLRDIALSNRVKYNLKQYIEELELDEITPKSKPKPEPKSKIKE